MTEKQAEIFVDELTKVSEKTGLYITDGVFVLNGEKTRFVLDYEPNRGCYIVLIYDENVEGKNNEK